MPENYTPAAAATGTWTEEEIRHQPRAWIRSLTNIDALRSALNNFLEPLLRKENLRVILTGAGTSAFIGDIIAPWLASHTGKNFSAVPTTDLVTNPMDYLNPAHPLLLISFGRSGNSPESVAAVELANQFVPECYHLPITCNEAGRSLPKRDQQRQRVCPADARRNARSRLCDDQQHYHHDGQLPRGFRT